MARLWLVRHGEASAGFGEERDPGLSPRGREQAEHAAELICRLLSDHGLDPSGLPELRCSPLRRCRETAAPIADHLLERRIIDPAVAEIPAPTEDLAARRVWLDGVLGRTWADLTDADRAWRDGVLSHFRSLERDAVVVTHFVPINVVVGEAKGSDAVMVSHCTNASITIVDVAPDGTIDIISEGDHGPSVVL